MHIPVYRAGFSVEIIPGELTVRTRKRYYLAAFAIQVHLIGKPDSTGYRRRWAFVQFGDKTCWLRTTAGDMPLIRTIKLWLTRNKRARLDYEGEWLEWSAGGDWEGDTFPSFEEWQRQQEN